MINDSVWRWFSLSVQGLLTLMVANTIWQLWQAGHFVSLQVLITVAMLICYGLTWGLWRDAQRG